MPIFGPKPCVNPFGKIAIFLTFWTSCFYSLERRFFVLEYRKTHFTGLYCVKRSSWKKGHFWAKTPLAKCQFFDFLNFLFFGLERRFFVLKYCKTHFTALLCLKKELAKIAIIVQKPWVNPFWQNAIFATFWTSCFYNLERRSFVLEYPKRHFPGPYCLKKRSWKNGLFWTKTMG